METPRLEYCFALEAQVGKPLTLGTKDGVTRRMIPILGGAFAGPGIRGTVRPGGEDWQFVAEGGFTELDAHYVIETDDGVAIEVRNQGVRGGPPEVMQRLAAGLAVAPDEYYFRTAPRFYPLDGKYSWLRESLFIGMGERYPDSVVIHVWRVA